MKRLLQFICIVLIVTIQLSFTTTGNSADCSIAHSGTFTYTDDKGDEVIVEIKGDSHVEYHKDRKYTIESQIKWSDDCQASITIVKTNLPNFPFKAGTVVGMKINKVDNGFIYYTGSVNGKTFKNILKKQGAEGVKNR